MATVHQTVAVTDEGQHSISLDQRTCKWDKPIVLVGLPGLEYTATGVDDVQFDKSRDQGYVVGTVSNGDKYFLRYEGTATLKDGVPLNLEGGWHYTGGTGKLRGLSGGGTYTAKPTASGGMSFEIEGAYQIVPAAK